MNSDCVSFDIINASTNANNISSTVQTLTNDDEKIIDVYIDVGDFKIGPILQKNYRIVEGKIFFNDPIDVKNTQSIRLKGKLRKQCTEKNDQVFDFNGIKIGPIYKIPFKFGTYYGQIENNQPHGIGHYKSCDMIYFGPWLKGKRTGIGSHTQIKSSVYRGEFLNDMYHGKGKLQFTTGPIKVMEGTWKDGELEGDKCMIEYENGDKYFGSVKKSQKDGIGAYVCFDKTFYNCQWKNDKKNGRGTCVKSDRTVIKCKWIDDLAYGPYKIIFDNGNVFTGNLISYEPMCGNGTLKYPSGSKYIGDICCGRCSGFGIYVHKSKDCYDGDKYIGYWRDNKLYGQATYFCEFGKYSCTTFWIDGMMNKSILPFYYHY